MNDLSDSPLNLCRSTVSRSNTRLALMIDGENVGHDHATWIMRTAEQLGSIIVLRVYCDPALHERWHKDLRFMTVCPGFGKGKNAVDIRLVIDALNIAHAGVVEGFVIVSSDGDFAPLAADLREKGFYVVGIGGAKASKKLPCACSEFRRIPEDVSKDTQVPAADVTEDKIVKELRELIRKGDPQGYLVADINAAIRRRLDVKIGKRPEKTWRAYLLKHASCFSVDPKGPNSRVRLK